jgi:hypothetical protein
MEKRLILILNPVEGTTTWENPDEMNHFEAVGLMEMVKLQIFAQVVKDQE